MNHVDLAWLSQFQNVSCGGERWLSHDWPGCPWMLDFPPEQVDQLVKLCMEHRSKCVGDDASHPAQEQQT